MHLAYQAGLIQEIDLYLGAYRGNACCKSGEATLWASHFPTLPEGSATKIVGETKGFAFCETCSGLENQHVTRARGTIISTGYRRPCFKVIRFNSPPSQVLLSVL